MTFTPTLKGAFLAGIGLWILAWLTLFKMDDVVGDTWLRSWISREKCLGWINGHRSTTLLGTELVNYGVHGVAQPEGVTFAAGGTIVNILMIFAVLPLRSILRRKN
jgi:hypothetical protein